MMQGQVHKFLLFYLLARLGHHAFGTEIINGRKVPDNLMLFMASLQNATHHHVCGGFLVSEDFVMTAAHCDGGKPLSVVVGTHNLKKVDDNTMRYTVKKCKHPSFRKDTAGDDIMLLKLSKKVRWNKRVQPARLPKADPKIKDKAKCRVAGWGFAKLDGKVVDNLQMAEVPFVGLERCKKEWRGRRLPDNVICASGLGVNKGFCKGDSGGPLVCGSEAVGVVSFNSECGSRYPNVYTDVSKYLTWINKILKKKDC